MPVIDRSLRDDTNSASLEASGDICDHQEPRRCPTCESLDHRECDEEIIRADDAVDELGPDFTIENHGTLFLFTPLTPAAREWINENVEEPRFWGNALVVEHRYARPLGNAIFIDGLEIEDA